MKPLKSIFLIRFIFEYRNNLIIIKEGKNHTYGKKDFKMAW